MHDLMHDLAQFVMRDECLGVVGSLEIPRGVRHLPLTARSYVPNASTPPTMRSILNPCILGSTVQKQKLVRALTLDAMEFRKELTWMQTLKLEGCLNLSELPKGITRLSSLRHLYLNRCMNLMNLRTMPAGISQLSCLKTLTKYIIGSRAGNSLRELKHLNLGGELELQGLRNVINVADTREADIHSKRDLDSLSFFWAPAGLLPYLSFNEESELKVENAEEVLEALKPHCGIKQLVIGGYSGLQFPMWMSDSQQLRNLVELRLYNCRQCEHLPALEMLPFLEVLIIYQMNAAKQFSNKTSAPGHAFPSLKRLHLTGMQNLERWWCIPEEREATLCFPCLIDCAVCACPKLKTMPLIPNVKQLLLSRFNPTSDHGFSVKEGFFKHLRLLEKLEIWGYDELVSLLANEEETRGMSPSLREMSIRNCKRLSAEHAWSLPSVERLEIKSCDALVSWPYETLKGLNSLKSLHIIGCKNLVEVMGLPSLEELIVYSCASLVELSMLPASLEKLQIYNCPNLTSFPQDLQQRLPHLRLLTIEECPELEKQYEPGGPFCHLVSQIPQVEIGKQQPRSKGRLKLAISPLLSSCH